MKLPGPKLRDSVDFGVAQFDPAGVKVPPKGNENRYVDIDSRRHGRHGPHRVARPGGTRDA
jgi:hypothetical protein